MNTNIHKVSLHGSDTVPQVILQENTEFYGLNKGSTRFTIRFTTLIDPYINEFYFLLKLSILCASRRFKSNSLNILRIRIW